MKGVKLLSKDINRGVKHLDDGSYHEMGGATVFSEMFWNRVKSRIGNVKKAECRYDTKKGYRLVLFSDKGFTVILRGCSHGYVGTGSRMTEKVLSECGFSENQIKKVFDKTYDEQLLKLYKRYF